MKRRVIAQITELTIEASSAEEAILKARDILKSLYSKGVWKF